MKTTLLNIGVRLWIQWFSNFCKFLRWESEDDIKLNHMKLLIFGNFHVSCRVNMGVWGESELKILGLGIGDRGEAGGSLCHQPAAWPRARPSVSSQHLGLHFQKYQPPREVRRAEWHMGGPRSEQLPSRCCCCKCHPRPLGGSQHPRLWHLDQQQRSHLGDSERWTFWPHLLNLNLHVSQTPSDSHEYESLKRAASDEGKG